MFFKYFVMTLVLFSLYGCNLREDDTLPSGVSPFDLIDDAIYITGEGLYATRQDNVNILVSIEESDAFEFVDASYNFTPVSQSYYIRFVDYNQEIIEVDELSTIIAIPSEHFTYLGLKYSGDYERFYPYPNSSTINAFGAFYENGYCYFILSDSAYYQTVSETEQHSEVSIEINPTQDSDINVSLYQAQFILPRNLLPLGVSQITLEKIEAPFLAEYNLRLSNFPVSFNMILNNPGQELYPILYIPVGPDLDSANLVVKQILPNGSQLIFHYDEELNNPDQYTIFGNCIILLVNNQGRFIIEKNVGEN